MITIMSNERELSFNIDTIEMIEDNASPNLSLLHLRNGKIYNADISRSEVLRLIAEARARRAGKNCGALMLKEAEKYKEGYADGVDAGWMIARDIAEMFEDKKQHIGMSSAYEVLSVYKPKDLTNIWQKMDPSKAYATETGAEQ